MSESKNIPSFWDESVNVKQKSLKNEKKLEGKLRAKRTPASGALPWPSSKGDEISKDFMYESKETRGTTIKLDLATIQKLCRDAAKIGKDPIFILTYYEMPYPLSKDWMVIPYEVFEKLMGSQVDTDV